MGIRGDHYEQDGNGAREALNEIEMLVHPGSMCWADWLLLELAERGFKVVPIGEDLAS